MIDIEEFERLDGLELAMKSKQWMDECDESFVEYFVKNYSIFSNYRFRVAVNVLSKVGSKKIRRILEEYLDSSKIDVRTTVNAYFYFQMESGLINELPKKLK